MCKNTISPPVTALVLAPETALTTVTATVDPTNPALTEAVARYLADRNLDTYTAVKDAALALLPPDTFTPEQPLSVAGVLSRSREIVAVVLSAQLDSNVLDGWRPAAEANDAPFGELRVVVDTVLTQAEIDRVVDALEFALRRTVWIDSLAAPTRIEVLDDARETVLEFRLNSEWVGRPEPRWDFAFNEADIRIIHGSDVRLSDRMGAGTRGTKEVEGIGKGRCGVQFFVR